MKNFVIQKLSKLYVDKVYELEKKYIGDCEKESIEKTISSETLSYYILLNNDEVMGFFECSIISPEAELYDIVIDENFQGNGYSKILMEYFIKLAKENNVETIFLEVNKINSKAIALYKKYGFQKYAERKKYYGENDAILMKKLL